MIDEEPPSLPSGVTGIKSLIERAQHLFRRREAAPKEPQMSLADSILFASDIPPFVSYFAAIPASLKDINGSRLMRVYVLIEQKVNKAAATDFVRMVLDMPNLAGSEFVKAVQLLGANNWIYNPGQDTRPGPDDIRSAHDLGGFAMGAKILKAGLMHEEDQTPIIKQQFVQELHRAGITIPSTTIIDV